MLIINKSENVTNELQYRLMRSNNIERVSDNDGYEGTVKDYIIYEEDEKTICSMLFEDGRMMATNSATFIKEVEAMISAFDKIPTIQIVSGKSKNGRTFFTCELAGQ